MLNSLATFSLSRIAYFHNLVMVGHASCISFLGKQLDCGALSAKISLYGAASVDVVQLDLTSHRSPYNEQPKRQ